VIQIAPQMRILVAVEAVDFRKGIDGLARVCKEALQADAFLCGGLQSVAPAARAHECSSPSYSWPTHILRRSFPSSTRRSARSFRREGHVELLF
jgi:hypothetical protein